MYVLSYYPAVYHSLSTHRGVELIKADAINHKDNIPFYFTGSVKVRAINDNIYLPGGIGGPFDSYGGSLFGGNQMSALEWGAAGVTGI